MNDYWRAEHTLVARQVLIDRFPLGRQLHCRPWDGSATAIPTTCQIMFVGPLVISSSGFADMTPNYMQLFKFRQREYGPC
jgi:hypothetical protein